MRNKWILLMVLLLLTSAFAPVACGGGGEGTPPNGEITSTQGLLETDTTDFNFTTVETLDLDGDGYDDKYVVAFEEEEVADDLLLQRTIEYEKEGDGLFQGEIVLHFKNIGNAEEYLHTEEISKEFAKTIDDLEFSVPPTEIIDPDPKVSWKISTDDSTEIRITSANMTTKKLASKTLTYIAYEQDVKRVEEMGDTEESMCERFADPDGKNACLLLTANYGEVPDISICDKMEPTSIEEECIILYDECGNYIEEYCKEYREYHVKDSCITLVAKRTLDTSLCDNISELGQEIECHAIVGMLTNPELWKQVDSADEVTFDTGDPSQSHQSTSEVLAKCISQALFAVLGDPSLCQQLPTDNAAEKCLDVINRRESVSDLIGACTECNGRCAEEPRSTPTCSPKPSPTPTSAPATYDLDHNTLIAEPVTTEELCESCGGVQIPKSAIRINEGKYDYCEANGVEVGVYRQWFDEGRTQPYKEWCYDSEGRWHGFWSTWYTGGVQKEKTVTFDHGVENGPFTSWWKNGEVRDEGENKDGETHGIYKSYREDGTLQNLIEYDNGRETGYKIEYGSDGQECTITDGTIGHDGNFTGTITRKCKSPTTGIWVETYEGGNYINGVWR